MYPPQCLLAVVVVLSQAAPAADPEAALKSKGLVRNGTFYVLKADEDAVALLYQRISGLYQTFERTQFQAAQTEQLCIELAGNAKAQKSQASSLRSQVRTNSNSDNKQGKRQNSSDTGQMERQAESLEENAAKLTTQRSTKLIELRKLQADLVSMQAQIPATEQQFQERYQALTKRYNDLGKDDAVKAALRDLNADQRKGKALVLGPAVDFGNYRAKVKTSSHETLIDRGMVLEDRARMYTWPSEQALAKRIRDVTALRDELKPPPAADLKAQRAAAEALLKAAKTQVEKDLAKAKLARIDSQDRVTKAAATKARRRTPAESREAFLEALTGLRDGVTQAREDREAQDDPTLEGALAEVNKSLPKAKALRMTAFPDLPKAETLLNELEAAYARQAIPRTKAGVSARIGDGPTRTLAIDPTAKEVRIPAAWAEGKATLDESAGAVTITALADGRSVPTRRATLGDLHLGMFALDGVPCLLLPDGEEAAASVGLAALDRLLVWDDPDGGRLVIARAVDAPDGDGVRMITSTGTTIP